MPFERSPDQPSPPARGGFTKIRENFYSANTRYAVLATPILATNVNTNLTLSDKFWIPPLTGLPPVQTIPEAGRLLLQFDFRIETSGVSKRFHELNFTVYNDASFQSVYANIATTGYEFAAGAAGIWFAGDQKIYEIPVTGPNLQISFTLNDTGAGTASQIQGLQIMGYFVNQ